MKAEITPIELSVKSLMVLTRPGMKLWANSALADKRIQIVSAYTAGTLATSFTRIIKIGIRRNMFAMNSKFPEI